MASQEEKTAADLDRISRKITACKTRQFTAFKNIVAVLGLITWKISTIPSRRSLVARLLRSLAGFACMAVTGIGIWIVYLYHTRIRRLSRSRDTMLDELVSGAQTVHDDDPLLRMYPGQDEEDRCVREPVSEVYDTLYI